MAIKFTGTVLLSKIGGIKTIITFSNVNTIVINFVRY